MKSNWFCHNSPLSQEGKPAFLRPEENILSIYMHLVILFVSTPKALEKPLNMKMYLHLLKTEIIEFICCTRPQCFEECSLGTLGALCKSITAFTFEDLGLYSDAF